jgi:hypothetical protein
VLAAAVLTAAAIGFVFGQATSSDSTAFEAKRIVTMKGTALDRDAAATLKLGARDTHGNWPMLLRVTGLQTLPESGYYRLYLTRGEKPLALCGSFSVSQGVVVVRFTASYDLKDFDKNGWVVTRQEPGHHEPTDIVLKTQA